MARSPTLDAQAKPPEAIKDVYKMFQKLDKKHIDGHRNVLDLAENNGANHSHAKAIAFNDLSKELQMISTDSAMNGERRFDGLSGSASLKQARIFEVMSIPGLLIYPSLLSSETQLHLLDKLFHRDLSNPVHQTNLHLHYDVPYPREHSAGTTASYFNSSSKDLVLTPKDANIHRPLTTQQFLSKKLRWMTLGGQYDWTNKVYPATAPPPFPSDIKNLIESLFPMKAEAAIVNLYSPGGTLSLHRDVSEECNQPLVSISLGCDGLFVIGLDEVDGNDRPRVETIRLRSGDAVLMSGQSRYAWHGVPKVLEGTCPDWMEDWPCVGHASANAVLDRRFEEWRGWMRGKRINMNVRQMFDQANQR